MKIILVLLSLYTSASLAQDEQCGVPKSAHGLVYGGKLALPGEWPWLVPLFMKKFNEFFCSSNLISHQHVLTVAHCIQDKRELRPRKNEDIYAYVGRYDTTLRVNEPGSIKKDIKKISVHPKWNPEGRNYDSDIAVLTLQSPVQYSNTILPVCLPEQDTAVGTQFGNVVGFGKSELPLAHEPKPKKIQISSITNDDCFLSDFIFAQFASYTTFCAGEKGKNPCQGDSGSGFFVNQNSWTIAGLVSSSIVKNCAESEFVLFTNVAKFTNWINIQISETQNRNSFNSVFESFDQDPNTAISTRINDSNDFYIDCDFKPIDTSYGCFVNDVNAPDDDTNLVINNGRHQPGKTNQNVDVMQIKNGSMAHFPDMTKVTETFPSLHGVGITFTKMKYIQRSQLRSLGNLNFFLISDNGIETIPPDTFADLTKLELIDICRNHVDIMEPQWISSMPDLKVFKARSNRFQYVPQDMFANNPKLEQILLDFNQIQYNYYDFSKLANLNILSMLDNKCVNLMYCNDPNNNKCIKSIVQFVYLIFGYCTDFGN